MFHYSKHGEEYVVGQEHLYEDPCDEWLDLVNNKLTSPNFPEPIDTLTECQWNLTAPHGHYIALDFEIIDVSDKWFVSKFYLCMLFLNFFNCFSFLIISMAITYQ